MTRLAQLIAQMEGFGLPGKVPTVKHNPGDLRHSPNSEHPGDSTHADDVGTIDTNAHGWQDLEAQLVLYAGRTIKVDPVSKKAIAPRLMTLSDAIYTFAPTTENKTAGYLAFICAGLLMPGATPLSIVLKVPAIDLPPLETPQQRGIRVYNSMTADMAQFLDAADIESPAGQRVIAYFMLRIKAAAEKA